MSLCGDRCNCLFPLLGPLSCVISWTGHLSVMLFLDRYNERNHSSVLQEVIVLLSVYSWLYNMSTGQRSVSCFMLADLQQTAGCLFLLFICKGPCTKFNINVTMLLYLLCSGFLRSGLFKNLNTILHILCLLIQGIYVVIYQRRINFDNFERNIFQMFSIKFNLFVQLILQYILFQSILYFLPQAVGCENNSIRCLIRWRRNLRKTNRDSAELGNPSFITFIQR